MMKLGGANEFPNIAKHSDAELLNITKESLDDKKPARVWGHCPFRECKATTLCQLRWKADHVVLTWFRYNVHDNQELPGSHKKCTKIKLIQCTKKSWYRWRRKLIGHRQNTERYVVLPHKHLRNTSSSLQSDTQLTLAYDMMYDSPGEPWTVPACQEETPASQKRLQEGRKRLPPARTKLQPADRSISQQERHSKVDLKSLPYHIYIYI